jgi:hypothetical protein
MRVSECVADKSRDPHKYLVYLLLLIEEGEYFRDNYANIRDLLNKNGHKNANCRERRQDSQTPNPGISGNRLKISSRYITALVLTGIYLLVTLSPLAPLAMFSPHVAHAITGECVGDCRICGCSPERSASHTCCCWQKKLKNLNDKENVPECCRKKGHHAEHEQSTASCPNEQRSSHPRLTCNCPCGSNKLVGLWGGEKFEQLPFHYSTDILATSEECLFIPHRDCLTDRVGDPPDPPPKLAYLS